MTFKQFLVGRRARCDDGGDFVRLALADSTMPDVVSWSQLKFYLEGRGTSYSQIEAAETVWKTYHSRLKLPPDA